MRLACEPEEIEADLLWYCSQFQKDILALNDNAPSSSKEGKQFAKTIQGLEGECIDKVLKDMRGHDACVKAVWCASMMTFKVWKVDRTQAVRRQGLEPEAWETEACMGHRAAPRPSRL